MMALGQLRAALVGGILVLATAGSALGQPFREVKYLGGVAGLGKRTGVLSLEGGELRFHDRKRRPVFARPLASAEASIASEKGTSGDCIVKGIRLLPLIATLSAGMADPWQGCNRVRAVLVVRFGDEKLRFIAPKGSELSILNAIRAAAEEASPRPLQADRPAE
jgi:hypothetical protein